MKILLTRNEVEGFKKTRDCEHIDCYHFSCRNCPINTLMEAGATIQEQDEWLEEHCEEPQEVSQDTL